MARTISDVIAPDRDEPPGSPGSGGLLLFSGSGNTYSFLGYFW